MNVNEDWIMTRFARDKLHESDLGTAYQALNKYEEFIQECPHRTDGR